VHFIAFVLYVDGGATPGGGILMLCWFVLTFMLPLYRYFHRRDGRPMTPPCPSHGCSALPSSPGCAEGPTQWCQPLGRGKSPPVYDGGIVYGPGSVTVDKSGQAVVAAVHMMKLLPMSKNCSGESPWRSKQALQSRAWIFSDQI
jgi:hypothetical protein